MTDTPEALPPLPEPQTIITDADVGSRAYTAWQMRDYARAALAQRQQVPAEWTMRLDTDAAETLKQTIGDDDTVSEITLSLCDGHEGRGLYVWLTEYPEEGSLLLAAAPALTAAPSAQAEPPKRDREADRARFPDTAFNRWLDEGISDAGHTVWDQIGSVVDAWHGWNNRPFYAAPPTAQAEPVAPLDIAAIRAACRAEALEEAAPIFALAAEVAEWHIGDGDECGVVARELLEKIAAIREMK